MDVGVSVDTISETLGNVFGDNDKENELTELPVFVPSINEAVLLSWTLDCERTGASGAGVADEAVGKAVAVVIGFIPVVVASTKLSAH